MSTSRPSTGPYAFHYNRIRNISAPEDAENGRDVYAGTAPATSFLDLQDDQNVRTYLVDAEGKKRRKPTQVHMAMRETLNERPQDFTILSGGFVLVAHRAEIHDKLSTAHLWNPSIVNGSQTQGELRAYLANGFSETFPVHVKFELVITDDPDLIAEIAIARNFQNDVLRLSIVGRRGQLDELDQHMRQHNKDWALQKTETDRSADYVHTEKLLQVITALIPPELWPDQKERSNPNKVFTYSMKARCLKQFELIQKYARPKDKRTHDDELARGDASLRHHSPALYKFYIDIAPIAWELYKYWKSHSGFKGCGIHSIKREQPTGNILEVPDGIIFPIIAALSAFAEQHKRHWRIAEVDESVEQELIDQAVTLYQEVAKHKPMEMGKSKACYSELFRTATIYRKVFQK